MCLCYSSLCLCLTSVTVVHHVRVCLCRCCSDHVQYGWQSQEVWWTGGPAVRVHGRLLQLGPQQTQRQVRGRVGCCITALCLTRTHTLVYVHWDSLRGAMIMCFRFFCLFAVRWCIWTHVCIYYYQPWPLFSDCESVFQFFWLHCFIWHFRAIRDTAWETDMWRQPLSFTHGTTVSILVAQLRKRFPTSVIFEWCRFWEADS